MARKGMEPWVTLLIGFIVMLLLLVLIVSGVIYKIIPGLKAPGDVYTEMQANYLVSACKTWVDSLGLRSALPDDLAAAIQVNNLGWGAFCTKEAIADPQKKCGCLAACVKALETQSACKTNPNAFQPDLWTPHVVGDPNIGTIHTPAPPAGYSDFFNVDKRMAPIYCFLARLKSIGATGNPPTCASGGGGMITVGLDLEIEYHGGPQTAYEWKEVTDGNSEYSAANTRGMYATCTVQCRDPSVTTCAGVDVHLEYVCDNRKDWWDRPGGHQANHCCQRAVNKPGTPVYVGTSACINPQCDTTSAQGRANHEWIMINNGPEHAPLSPAYLASASYQFRLAPSLQELTWYGLLSDDGGWNDEERYLVRCVASWNGNDYTSSQGEMVVGGFRITKVQCPLGICYTPQIDTASKTYKPIYCLPGRIVPGWPSDNCDSIRETHDDWIRACD